MRDRIAHGYDYVEPEQVIIVCRDDMPKLKEFCSNVIDDGNNDIKVVENVDNSKEK